MMSLPSSNTPQSLERYSSQQLYKNEIKDMKRKNLVRTLWEIAKKMSRKKEKKEKLKSEFSENINRGALSCFAELCTELACNNKITEVNLSRCNINIYYAIELANLLQKNTNIQVLSLAGCNLNSFSLSCIFKSMIDHTGLTHLNLSNNKGFTITAVEDFCKYVLKGKNPLFEINLSFCNIDNKALSLILPNLKHLKSLKRFIVSLVNFNNSESILALRSAMLNYTGDKSLDYLDISWNQISYEGLELLSDVLFMSVRQINIRSLNLEFNRLKQDSIEFLETILLKLNVEEVNLSKNKFYEFQNQQLLNKRMTRIDLSYNKFEEIPTNFFLNVLSINLSNNNIKYQGAYKISQVLSSKKVQWMELNLNNNFIQTKGFISLIYALIENQRLIHLSVANNNITGEGILVYIFNHEQLNLQYLDLSLNYLRYDLVYALISMMKECKMRTIVLSKLIQDENDLFSGKNELFEIKCTNLRVLNFSGNSCMIQSILNSLSQQYNRIEYLNLNNCGINTLELIEPLSQFLTKSYTLQTLLLAKNHLGEMDEINFKILSEGLTKNQSLLYLDLSSNKLKIKILYLINGLANCRYLKYLDISKNLIYETKNIIHDFPKLLANPSLQSIDISKNQIGGQTLLHTRKTLYKQYKQFPQINFSQQQFTADDLHIITQIISESHSIKRLELADNYYLNYMNNVMMYGENVKVESLSINKILFRQDSFSNLLNTIELNYKHIRFLEISNTLLFQEQLIQLFSSIKLIKNLIVLILDYQSFKERDKDVFDALYTCLNCFRNLKHFSVRKSTLSTSFYKFVSELLKKSQKLIELDLSGNSINYCDFQILCNGIFSNQSVTTLNFRNCQLTDDSFLLFLPCLHTLSQIKMIDISQNDMTLNLLYEMQLIFRGHKSSVSSIKLQNIQSFLDNNLIINLQLESHQLKSVFGNLNILDLSNNYKQNENIIFLMDYFINKRIINNIQILILNNCGIRDDQTNILANLIDNNHSIQDISLFDNRITGQGFKKIFDIILLNNNSLIKLNVSKNFISDQYFKDLTPAKLIPLTSFQLLILNDNLLKGHSNEGILYLLQKNPKLYVYNDWISISEQFACQIVNQYVLFVNQYNLQKEIPIYLTQLIIRDSKLSDQFFIWFGSQYFKIPYLEKIDFRGSSTLMTGMSKMHMYIDIINENFDNYNLIEVCFDQNFAQEPNIFDDGIFKYMLLNLKDLFQNKNHISLHKNGQILNEIEQVRWGKIGKWVVHWINKTLNLIQDLSYDFRFSSALHSYTRKGLTKIKMSMTAGTILECLKVIMALGALSMRRNLSDVLSRCEQNIPCFQADVTYGFMGEGLVMIFLIVSQSTMALLMSIEIRLKAKPDYCIQTTEMVSYQHYKFAHKIEIWLFFLQLIISFNYLLECRIIASVYELYQYAQHQNISDYIVNQQIILIIFMASFLSFKTALQLYISIKSLIFFLQSSSADQANLLQASIIKVQADNQILIEQALCNYCPQCGTYIKGRLMNYKQIFEPIMGLFELALLILTTMVAKNRRIFFNDRGYTQIYTTTDILILVYIIKTIIKFCKHFYCTLFSRPPQLKVSDLNEALLLRRYKKMGDSLSIIEKQPKKVKQKTSSQQSIIQKTTLDNKFYFVSKTKSDRSIIVQDYVRENPEPQQNQSMKDIYQ